ncbi:MAG: DUF4097 family beta strand repeat protein, partial [Acidobacteriales bacterium]|nr:DUF4097 family beta strand repeat protein [Terriglobales bacterium]
VEAGDIRGNAHVGTGSGNVRLRLAGTGDVRVSAGSGDLTVENVRGGLDAGTGSGSIEVSGTPERSWTLHTGSGEVTLRVGKDAKMNLYARSSSGGVHSDIPITMNGSLERHSVRGTVNGGGPSVEIRTGSGGIEIR